MNIAYAPRPTLVLIRGIPGSGKSTIALKLQEQFGAEECILLDPDAISVMNKEYAKFSAALLSEGIDVKFHPYRFLRALATKAINQHKVIVWNQAFTSFMGMETTVVRLVEHADANDIRLAILIAEIEIDPEIARARIEARGAAGGHVVPDMAQQRYARDYESYAGHGYEVVTLHGADPVDASVETITRALRTL